MRHVCLVLVGCALFGYLARPLPEVVPGMPRSAVELSRGRPLSREACLARYDMPLCATCLTLECPDVSLAVYPGPLVVLYDPAGLAFRISDSRGERFRPWVCPGDHGCGWTAAYWKR